MDALPPQSSLPHPSPAAAPSPPTVPEGVKVLRRMPAREAAFAVDPEFRDLLPRGKAQLEVLRASLRAHGGTLGPVLLWAGRDVVVDGHCRLEMCREEDLSVWVGEMDFPDREAVLAWIRRTQWAARNLSPLGASVLRGEAYNGRKGRRGGNRKGRRSKSQSDTLIDAARQAAEEFKVSAATIKRDGELAGRVTRITANCGPQARQALLCPEHRVTRHGIAYLVQRDAEYQRWAIAELQRRGRLPPREPEEAKFVRLPRQEDRMAEALARLLGEEGVERLQGLLDGLRKVARWRERRAA
jgi:hypothetical protein